MWRRHCEHFADIPLLQVVEQSDFKDFSKDRVLQLRCVEQNIVPQMIKQLEKVPKMVSQNKIQRRTAEQIFDMPVPTVVEEHIGIAKVSSQNRVHQRFEEQSVGRERILKRRVEQIVDVPAGQMAEGVCSGEVPRNVHRQGLVLGCVV